MIKTTDSLRVFRGGCWGGYAVYCGVGVSYGHDPDSGSNSLGFRVLRNLQQNKGGD